MTGLPHDTTDLFLAPVALALDERLAELGRMSPTRLSLTVAMESDTPDWNRDLRERALLRTITHLIDCHGWDVAWDPRGLRLSHEGHTVVLGVPASFAAFLDGSSTEENSRPA